MHFFTAKMSYATFIEISEKHVVSRKFSEETEVKSTKISMKK